MKRIKRHKIKKEKLESSSSHGREHEEHDLAYYIHDRVELMHQVFSLLKYKELKAMAPECIKDLAIGDLQELCTEELLGISSKRLLAVLDGADPPSDTESSSTSPPPDELETISLDSISSDEELLNTSHKKKKHKHRSRHSSKKKEKAKEPEVEENAELSKASRAGLTVLELLELQARARAIRAQLQQEQLHKNVQEATTVDSSHHSSDNEVEIKEEPADVVEISSEDEKPDVNQLNNKIVSAPPSAKNTEAVTNNQTENPANDGASETVENPTTVTKRINDLVITVPQAKTTRKIKLNRNNKVTISLPNTNKDASTTSVETPSTSRIVVEKNVASKVSENSKNTEPSKDTKLKKKKKDKKKKSVDKDGSDHDEITLQLSDSEKMDLFENLDESRKNYDKVSSSSEDTDSSSDDSESENDTQATKSNSEKTSAKNYTSAVKIIDADVTTSSNAKSPEINVDTENSNIGVESNLIHDTNNSQVTEKNNEEKSPEVSHDDTTVKISPTQQELIHNDSNSLIQNEIIAEQTSSEKMDTVESENSNITNNVTASLEQNLDTINSLNTNPDCENINVEDKPCDKESNSPSKDTTSNAPIPGVEIALEIRTIEDIPLQNNDTVTVPGQYQKDDNNDQCATEKSVSDGELSDRESSEVEAMDVQHEVVCISDEDKSPKKKEKKKKKKKDKKSKKSKKSKSDFREDADQNFYKDDAEIIEPDESTSASNDNVPIEIEITETIDLDSDEVCEIFELSDDSSCSEIEGTVLSKEPTAEEIEALSAKIDEIKREEVVTDKQIEEHERMLAEKERNKQDDDDNNDHLSWRDRYLDSKKVKKVLTTANIFNALRKKNKELKKKIEDSKKKNEDEVVEENIPKEITVDSLEEGSIEQYNTLQGLNKYVDPVKEPEKVENNEQEGDKTQDNTKIGENVTKEMKKDAKQLLKMYRRLLKYNDIKKQTDPNKKKKKKQKKKEKAGKNTDGTVA